MVILQATIIDNSSKLVLISELKYHIPAFRQNKAITLPNSIPKLKLQVDNSITSQK